MNFTNKFQEEEWYGREALKELKKLYPNSFKYEIKFNMDEYGCYDAFFHIIDETTHKIVKRVIIEIKQRSEDYPEFILENKKYNSLIKYRKDMGFTEDEMSLWYMNFTPTKTIIWDLDKIDIKIETLMANKATVESITNKINKKVIYISPDSGKIIPYILNRNYILRNIQLDKVLEVNKKNIKKELGFFLPK